jgi:hypothetical protein
MNNRGLPTYLNSLSQIIQLRGNSCDVEALDLMEQSLTTHLRFNGPDHMSVALSNYNVGTFHQNKAKDLSGMAFRNRLRQAEPYYIEAARISRKLNGPNHPQTREYVEYVQWVSHMLI